VWNASRLGAIVLLAVQCLAPFPTLAAGSLVRVGNEFQVHASTLGPEGLGVVTAIADGGFVFLWHSPYYGSRGRRLDSQGVPQGFEFQISTGGSPVTASAGDDGFVVAWVGGDHDGPSLRDIFARRFDLAGNPLGAEFLVNSSTTGFQNRPVIAADADGDFVIVWHVWQPDGEYPGTLFARRFDSSGTAQSLEFRVNTFTPDRQRNARVAMDDDGDFVVVWSSYDQAPATRVFGRRFDSTGTHQAAEFQIDDSTFTQTFPTVAIRPGGDFLVAWDRFSSSSAGGVFGRRFDSAGAPLGNEFLIDTSTATPGRPAIAMHGDGDFVVVWSSSRNTFSQSIVARRFDTLGTAATDQIQVSFFTAWLDFYPDVALNDDGRFVIAWSRTMYCQFPCHVQTGDVFAQRFTSNAAPLDVDSDGTVAALTDGLLVLRFLFHLNGPALANGAVSDLCARCAPSTIEAHLEALDALDVDGDGTLDPLTDGILILRFLFGFRGNALTSGAVGSECVRCDATTIEPYLAGLTSTGG
jgi:hypothetical protein